MRQQTAKAFLVLAAVLALTWMAVGCTDTEMARLSSYGNNAIIELYSGGNIVATFKSTGKVECTEGGICDFMDTTTGKLVRTTGDILVRVQ